MGRSISISSAAQCKQGGFSGVQMLLIVLLTIILTLGISFFVVRTYIFPSELSPVTLSAKEAVQLDQKLNKLGWQPDTSVRNDSITASQISNTQTAESRQDDLSPKPYRELNTDRQVTFSEKEVNAMIGRNPDFSRRVAIDFSDDLASAKILVPIPDDFPLMPGRILRVNAGVNIHLDASRRPVVALVGVSLMGVPIPNAWLGNMKNVNLVGEFGDSGFWNAFADGVEELEIREGELYIKLRK
ncbi:arginine N-succinyltransferase [Shewanella violacea]|nr:arginine N-succinyltransferase [Shewanella violacea]